MEAGDPAKELLASYRRGVERLVLVVTAAVDAEGTPTSQLSAGLLAALELLAAEPQLARLLLTEPLAAEHPLRPEHERSLTRLAQALPCSAPAVSGEDREERARLVAGGLVSHLSGKVVAGEVENLPASHPTLLAYLISATGIASTSPDG